MKNKKESRMELLVWLDELDSRDANGMLTKSKEIDDEKVRLLSEHFFKAAKPHMRYAKRLRKFYRSCLVPEGLPKRTSEGIAEIANDMSQARQRKAQRVMQLFNKLFFRWPSLRKELYITLHAMLLDSIQTLEKYPFRKKILEATLHFYFKNLIRDTLDLAMVDCGLCSQSDLPGVIFVPTLRRLAMYNFYQGRDWIGFLDEHLSVPVRKTFADEILQEVTKDNYAAPGKPDTLSLQYSPTCANNLCGNQETSKKPHKHRCHECWHFHACSDFCKALASVRWKHDKWCSVVAGVSGYDLREETEAHLAHKNQNVFIYNVVRSLPRLDVCYFCSSRLEHLPIKKIPYCQGCKNIQYCSKECQLWDWKYGGHKAECFKE